MLHVNHAPRNLFGDSIDENSDSPLHIRNYWARHRETFALGVDGWWPDDGDELPLEARLTRHRCYYEGPLQDRPNVRPWSLHRTGYAGVAALRRLDLVRRHRWQWETLAAHVSVGLNHGLSLTPFWGSDTGGFLSDARTHWRTLRALVSVLGVLPVVPIARAHVASAPAVGLEHRRIWPDRKQHRNVDPAELHNAEVEPICRKYLELRYRLLPYNYTRRARSLRHGPADDAGTVAALSE